MMMTINNNKEMKLGRHTIYMRKLITGDIDTLEEWHNVDGTLCTFEQMQGTFPNFPLSRWQYIQIKRAIPWAWREKMLTREMFGINLDHP